MVNTKRKTTFNATWCNHGGQVEGGGGSTCFPIIWINSSTSELSHIVTPGTESTRPLPANPAVGSLGLNAGEHLALRSSPAPRTQRGRVITAAVIVKAAAEVPDEELSGICRGLATGRSLTQSTRDFYLEPKTLAFPSFVRSHSTTSWFDMIRLATATGTLQTNLQNAPISATTRTGNCSEEV